MPHKVITPPSAEPISLVELRAHLRLDIDIGSDVHPEDALILAYLSAAREHAELFVGFALAPQVWEMALDAFPADAVELEGGAVEAIQSVTYVDDQGDLQTVNPSAYTLDSYSTPNWLLPAFGGEGWPSTLPVANAVKIRYQVGGGLLPASIRAALLLMVGHFYSNREEVSTVQTYRMPMGVGALLWPHRTNLGV